MKKIILGILIAVVVASLTVGTALALPTLRQNQGTNRAGIASPAVDDNTLDVEAPPEFVVNLPESELTKIIFIRYAPGKEPLPVCDYDEICEPRENWKSCPSDCPKEEPTPTPEPSACYGFLSGAKPKWNWVEDYAYSQADLGLSSAQATGTWDAVTSATIFGSGVSGTYPWGVYDYQNAVSYGDYSDPNVIAVTAIWFRAKNIYEYDIMFDINYFPGDGRVDLDSVVLHEFGHGAGLDDLYDSVCSDEVMYGYYTGVKTTLGDGDTAGIQELYGM